MEKFNEALVKETSDMENKNVPLTKLLKVRITRLLEEIGNTIQRRIEDWKMEDSVVEGEEYIEEQNIEPLAEAPFSEIPIEQQIQPESILIEDQDEPISQEELQ